MHAVREHDQVGAGLRIDQHRGAGEPRVDHRLRREERHQGAREHRGDVPAQRAAAAAVGRARPHGLHGLGLEDSHAVEGAAVDQHPANAREVGRRREHPRVAGHAAQQARARIVDLAHQHLPVGPLGGGDVVAPGGRRLERRVAQAEGLEHGTVEVAVERLAADPSHDLAEQDEADVAVLGAGAGHVVEGQPRQAAHGVVDGGVHHARRRDGREARAVGEQPLDRHLGEVRLLELAEITAERRVELDGPALHQRHHGQRGAHGLGQRGDVEHGVDVHRLGVGDQPPEPPGALEQDLVTAADEHDDAGDLPRLDGFPGDVVHRAEVGGLGGSHASAEQDRDQGQEDERGVQRTGGALANHESDLSRRSDRPPEH